MAKTGHKAFSLYEKAKDRKAKIIEKKKKVEGLSLPDPSIIMKWKQKYEISQSINK